MENYRVVQNDLRKKTFKKKRFSKNIFLRKDIRNTKDHIMSTILLYILRNAKDACIPLVKMTRQNASKDALQ